MAKFNYILFVLIAAAFALLPGCANQLPPSGGEDDKEPPKAEYINPKPNTVNFKGKSISIKFDEYVDRRSFTESFFVTPKPEGEMSFNWSGREVEVEFPKGLKSNTTYLFITGKLLKDIHNNFLSEPIQFAVSTGDKIDMGKLSGRVYSKNYDRVYVFLYNLAKNASPDPAKDKADYMIPVNNEGVYKTGNLAPGVYRLFSVFDNDRNGLYDKALESISCTDRDYAVSDSLEVRNCNFVMPNMIVDRKFYSGKDFFASLKSDSTGIIFSNVTNGQKTAGPLSRMYFYCKSSLIDRNYIASNTSMKDTLGNRIRMVFNWYNDTLFEISPTGNYNFGTPCILSFDLNKVRTGFVYSLKYTVAEEIKCVEISGFVKNRSDVNGGIIVNILNADKPEQNFARTLASDSVFAFQGLIEGDYYLFAYNDVNSDSEYDFGEPAPFRPAEKFFFFNKKISVKGGWKAENLTVEF
ncbi:MAG: Ig-like domain-containing protein [Bacteroidetes bacterium]|nr:Ig-like domain-containing protein [Bacteroidota bacterium]